MSFWWLALLLFPSVLCDQALIRPLPKKPASLVQKRIPSPRKKSARFSAGFAKQLIEQHLRENVFAFTQCFEAHHEIGEARFQLTLRWEGSGKFTTLHLVPEIPEPTRRCLQERIANWDLPPHPGGQPFSYQTALVLGAD